MNYTVDELKAIQILHWAKTHQAPVSVAEVAWAQQVMQKGKWPL